MPPTELTSKQVSTLKRIAIIGNAVVAISLIFWGSFAKDNLGINSIDELCRYAGIICLLTLVTVFSSAYFTTNRVGYVLFWFYGSIFFNFTWELPLWTIGYISKAEINHDNLRWAIIWWSYNLSDTVYRDVTKMMVTVEIWWLMGNLLGIIGLYKWNINKRAESLLLLCLCGGFQAYNASMYLFICGYIDNFEPIGKHWQNQFIYWGFNGFWCCSGLVASYNAFRILLDEYLLQGNDTKKRK